MTNYFRITGYYPKEDIGFIADSYGCYEKLWQFSAYLIEKGIKVLAVGSEGKFTDGNIGRAEYDKDRIILRACSKGMPVIDGNTVEVNGKRYEKK